MRPCGCITFRKRKVVLDKENGKYEPINLKDTYTIASYNYFLLECGGGMKMLDGAEILQNEGVLDVEVVERYVTEALNGVIGEEYGDVTANITFTEGEIKEAIKANPKPYDLDGVKRRTRAQMGRCQGGFCMPYIVELLAKEHNIKYEEVTKMGGNSFVNVSKTKEDK